MNIYLFLYGMYYDLFHHINCLKCFIRIYLYVMYYDSFQHVTCLKCFKRIVIEICSSLLCFFYFMYLAARFPITGLDHIVLSRNHSDGDDGHQRAVIHATVALPSLPESPSKARNLHVFASHFSLSVRARNEAVVAGASPFNLLPPPPSLSLFLCLSRFLSRLWLFLMCSLFRTLFHLTSFPRFPLFFLFPEIFVACVV